eukprot:gnl/TRDRNA2_/TRDRNA2_156134_c0_seq1.p1 gnl/TRDRNA2_/TRDRNA2_156134_c0~~gnl/TRDRNA2_/TRDRNA2_156134_c0_seq1.p1  ORF type:complete len:146 (+),score=27.02 gnl/TRDRNA2_/TRDRNA2_156134_c0_seq1:229-666(+)
MFNKLDVDGDGRLSYEEFHGLKTDERLHAAFTLLDIGVDDADVLFDIIKEDDGTVMAQDFIRGLKSLTGQTKRMDVMSLMRASHRIEQKVDALEEHFGMTKDLHSLLRLPKSEEQVPPTENLDGGATAQAHKREQDGGEMQVHSR